MPRAMHPSAMGAAYIVACEELARSYGVSVWEEYEVGRGSGETLYLVYTAQDAPSGLGESREVYGALSPERAAYRAAEAAVDGSLLRCPRCSRAVALSDIADERGPEETELALSLCWLYYSSASGRFSSGCRYVSLVR